MINQTELMRSILTSPKAQTIIDYVSPIYGKSYVALWLFQAIGTVLGEACDLVESLKHEIIPTTATLLLDLWEEHYGIPKDSSLSVEQRRARLAAKTQSRGACTPYKLQTAVSGALGGAEVEVTENVAKNTFRVTVKEYVPDIAPAVAVIERMKPAHLIYELHVVESSTVAAEMKTAIAITHYERYAVEVQ